MTTFGPVLNLCVSTRLRKRSVHMLASRVLNVINSDSNLEHKCRKAFQKSNTSLFVSTWRNLSFSELNLALNKMLFFKTANKHV